MAIPEINYENVWKIYYYVAIFSTILFVLSFVQLSPII